MMDLQSELVAAVANGDVELPDRARMRDDIARERRRMMKVYPDSPRYGLELDPREYGAASGGTPSLPTSTSRLLPRLSEMKARGFDECA